MTNKHFIFLPLRGFAQHRMVVAAGAVEVEVVTEGSTAGVMVDRYGWCPWECVCVCVYVSSRDC